MNLNLFKIKWLKISKFFFINKFNLIETIEFSENNYHENFEKWQSSYGLINFNSLEIILSNNKNKMTIEAEPGDEN